MKVIKTVVRTHPLLVLFFVWVIVQLLLLLSLGIVTGGEATQYSNEANRLLQHRHFSETKYIFYSAYILLHVLLIKIQMEAVGVYLVQLITNLTAMYMLFNTTCAITNKKTTAFITVLLLVLCYSWQYWTVFLYTESFFCSLVIIFACLLFSTARNNTKNIAALLVFLMILFARPTGMFLVPVMCVLAVFRLARERKVGTALIIVVFASIVFFSFLNFAMKGGSSYDFMKPLLENNVLCYIPEEPQTSTIVLSSSTNSLESILSYILQSPMQFLKLAGLKLISYWGMIRPYYSNAHNIFLACFFYPLYFFAAKGVLILRNLQPYLALFIVALFTIFTLSVIFTCDDWNNRFNMPIIPFIMLPAGVGIMDLYNKLFKPRFKNL